MSDLTPNVIIRPSVPVVERMIATNGISLHVVEAGPAQGPLVLLLHGFPEFWCAWGRQIDRLASAGYRVWAVDQRGYNLSDKPSGIPAYNLNQLSDDVIGLLDAAGVERAALVGHDWGAAVTWWTANRYPERLTAHGRHGSAPSCGLATAVALELAATPAQQLHGLFPNTRPARGDTRCGELAQPDEVYAQIRAAGNLWRRRL